MTSNSLSFLLSAFLMHEIVCSLLPSFFLSKSVHEFLIENLRYIFILLHRNTNKMNPLFSTLCLTFVASTWAYGGERFLIHDSIIDI